jgi:hypothetical protein
MNEHFFLPNCDVYIYIFADLPALSLDTTFMQGLSRADCLISRVMECTAARGTLQPQDNSWQSQV